MIRSIAGNDGVKVTGVRMLTKMTKSVGMNERLKTLLAEYGQIALVIHFAIFFASVFIFWLAIGLGFEFGGEANLAPSWLTESGSARLVAAYIASQVIKPFRLGATIILTPIVAKTVRKPEIASNHTNLEERS